MLNQEFCFGQIEFKSSVSHLSGDVEWAVEYAHLELWREAKAGEKDILGSRANPL